MIAMYNKNFSDDIFYTSCRHYSYETSVKKCGFLTETDKNLILDYITERRVSCDLSQTRCNKISSVLIHFRRFMQTEYIKCTMSDIYNGMMNLRDSGATTYQGHIMSDTTKADYVVILKPFLIWLADSYNTAIIKQKIAALKRPHAESKPTMPEDLISSEEIDKLISVCKCSRNRALIALIYESGARIGEVGRLNWGDLIFDADGIGVYINDRKTKKYRYVRITAYTAYIAAWKADTTRSKPNDPVFIDLQRKDRIKYDAIVRTLQRCADLAGIKKRVNPHIFRHSRITHLINAGYQESVVKKAMWNNLNTQMFSTYVSLSEQDIDDEFLSKSGVVSTRKKQKIAMPVPCGNCHYANPPRSKYCAHCGAPLTEDAEKEINSIIDDAINYINQNPDFREFYKDYQNFLNAKKEYERITT